MNFTLLELQVIEKALATSLQLGQAQKVDEEFPDAFLLIESTRDKITAIISNNKTTPNGKID